MKIRHPFLLKALGCAAAGLIRLWIGSLRYRYQPIGPNVDPNQPGFKDRYIYALWHENMLLLAYQYSRPDIAVLISQHADGQLITEVVRRLGMGVVRGSSTRGGIEAVRRMLKLGNNGHLAITPDGPRGPRRNLQLGLIYLASRTGLPIVPVGIGYQRPWRLKSWDRFALPRPFTLATCVTAPPIVVPPELGVEELEAFRQRTEQAMSQVSSAAEAWAASGQTTPPAELLQVVTEQKPAWRQAG